MLELCFRVNATSTAHPPLAHDCDMKVLVVVRKVPRQSLTRAPLHSHFEHFHTTDFDESENELFFCRKVPVDTFMQTAQ